MYGKYRCDPNPGRVGGLLIDEIYSSYLPCRVIPSRLRTIIGSESARLSLAPEGREPLLVAIQSECAICRYLGTEPRMTTSSLGILTSIDALVEGCLNRLDDGSGSQAHLFLPVCPEHVVDIYRGRITGVAMAWRMASTAN